jgi:hypothetical protein
LLGWLNQGGWGGRVIWHAWGREEVFRGFWLGSPKVRDHWEDLGVGVRITLRWTWGRMGSMGRTGFSWLRIGFNGGFLWTRWWTFGLHKEIRIFLTIWVTISFAYRDQVNELRCGLDSSGSEQSLKVGFTNRR